MAAPQQSRRDPALEAIARSGPRGAVWASALALLPLLAGCASLPDSGPTGHDILRDSAASAAPQAPLPFRLAELATLADLPGDEAPPPLAARATPLATDRIGPGDVLDIAIYEAGVSLFAGPHTSADAEAAATPGAAVAEHLPPMRVDDGGFIRVPYAGQMQAAGRTTGELAGAIRHALRGLSQDPQVVVAIGEDVSGSVIVGGEVGHPGRLVLATAPETLSDAIALAGGYRGEAKDLEARVVRGGDSFTYRLADVLSGPARDMQVTPGDRIALLRAPQSYSVMGAPGKVDDIPFAKAEVSLAEAVAAAGGAHPYLGDASAVFVFRFVGQPGGAMTPVVYHLDMMRAGGFFLAQRFLMRDKDVLYIGNAASNQPTKLITLVSQLFSPIVAVESGLAATGAIR